MTRADRDQRLRNALAKRAITQELIAIAANCSQSFVSRVLKGEKSSCRVMRVAAAFLSEPEEGR